MGNTGALPKQRAIGTETASKLTGQPYTNQRQETSYHYYHSVPQSTHVGISSRGSETRL